jgi:hypothetical protein
MLSRIPPASWSSVCGLPYFHASVPWPCPSPDYRPSRSSVEKQKNRDLGEVRGSKARNASSGFVLPHLHKPQSDITSVGDSEAMQETGGLRKYPKPANILINPEL